MFSFIFHDTVFVVHFSSFSVTAFFEFLIHHNHLLVNKANLIVLYFSEEILQVPPVLETVTLRDKLSFFFYLPFKKMAGKGCRKGCTVRGQLWPPVSEPENYMLYLCDLHILCNSADIFYDRGYNPAMSHNGPLDWTLHISSQNALFPCVCSQNCLD